MWSKRSPSWFRSVLLALAALGLSAVSVWAAQNSEAPPPAAASVTSPVEQAQYGKGIPDPTADKLLAQGYVIVGVEDVPQRELTRDEIDALLKEGYGGQDILTAGDLVATFGGDPRLLLERHARGESWDAIRAGEEERAAALPPEARSKRLKLEKAGGRESLLTDLDLTEAEVTALVEAGHALPEIFAGAAYSVDAGLDLPAVARAKAPGKRLLEAVREADLKRTPEQRQTDRGAKQTKIERARQLRGIQGSQGGQP